MATPPEKVQQSQAHLRRPHHSSPEPGDKQTPFPKPPERNVKRTIGKMPSVPMHVTKHSEPVGRPKNRNYE